MKTKLISTFNVRGGVGKSLLTCMLADYVSLLRKNMSKSYPNVLVIDFDPQSSTSIDILDEKAYSKHVNEGQDLGNVAEQLTSKEKAEEILPSITIKRHQVSDGTRADQLPSLDIIHSSNRTRIREFSCRKSIEDSVNIASSIKGYLENHYDFVFIDLPAGSIPNSYTQIGHCLAENVIIPTNISNNDKALQQTFELLEENSQLIAKKCKIQGIIMNFCKRETVLCKRRIHEVSRIAKLNNTKVFRRNIPYSERVAGLSINQAVTFNQKYGAFRKNAREITIELLESLGIKVRYSK